VSAEGFDGGAGVEYFGGSHTLGVSIPPKYLVSAIMGYLKGKLSIRLFQKYERLGKRYWGQHL